MGSDFLNRLFGGELESGDKRVRATFLNRLFGGELLYKI
ncbi:protein of unknown function [Candidatus Nitrosacidococcus tergens]|uniref:Uncharacterized protein n=1 Tax=Candidatus Nitrosacidococcus tergens TaxID=553981 RepID=A0A7G1Q9G5_9GAMM|nr:protein of unknown function [Candidatus Nitrosacidococcus tergens]